MRRNIERLENGNLRVTVGFCFRNRSNSRKTRPRKWFRTPLIRGHTRRVRFLTTIVRLPRPRITRSRQDRPSPTESVSQYLKNNSEPRAQRRRAYPHDCCALR